MYIQKVLYDRPAWCGKQRCVVSGGTILLANGEVWPLLLPTWWRVEMFGLCCYQPVGGWRCLASAVTNMVEGGALWPHVVPTLWRMTMCDLSVDNDLVKNGYV